LFSTRDAKKSEETLKRLNAHLQKTLKHANVDRAPGLSLLLEGRIRLEGVLADLTKLPTVKALAKQLLARRQRLDSVIWNAGIAGWSYLNYYQAIPALLKGLVQATTYPKFNVCDVGALTKPQLSGYGSVHMFPEPRLGQVFTANVFGHYMLTHWLAPLMDTETRIVWITSISGTPETFRPDDLQGIRAKEAYESSKRLTDLLVLTSDLPSTQSYVKNFLPTQAQNSKPTELPQMYSTHPGVIATSIAGLNWFISIFMFIALYIARWVGSPWHPISAYKGAISAVFAALAPASQLADLELREGKGKWGSATDVYGNERVVRTEVEGWGYGRELGYVPSGSIASRRQDSMKTTQETREDFESQGTKVWREMEEMRVDWEKRLGKVEVEANGTTDM
jgi:3-keto steroid reductase